LSAVNAGIGGGSFRWVACQGPVGALFSIPSRAQREVQLVVPDARAVVLGSTTPDAAFPLPLLTSRGYQVARRTSGGGAVIVTPVDQVWLNVHLLREDPLVVDDIGRSFFWLGELLADVISDLVGQGVPVEVVRTRNVASELSRLVCFGGLGFGEVLVAGKKVMGLAQRRTRAQVTYHVAVLINDRQSDLLGLLGNPFLRDRSIGSCGLSEWGVTHFDLLARLHTAFGAPPA